VQDIHLDVSETNTVTLFQPAIGRKGAHIGEAEHLALLWHAVDPELIFTLRAFDRQGQPLGQFSDSAGVIDMAMRNQYLLQFHPVFLDRSKNARDIATRIDHRRALRLVTPQKAAILFKRRNGNDLVFYRHGMYLLAL
jgi:hypothetical protein